MLQQLTDPRPNSWIVIIHLSNSSDMSQLTSNKTLQQFGTITSGSQGSILTVVRWPQASKNTNGPLKCLSG